MKMRGLILSSLLILMAEIFSYSMNDKDEILKNILIITGANDVESLSQQEIEKFEGLLNKPLKINIVSIGAMVSSGLFSQYQIASIMDYRKRTGDILSINELARVDGIGKELAFALSPFINLASSKAVGERGVEYNSGNITLRTVWKNKGWMEGAKINYSIKDKLDFAVATSNRTGSKLFPPDRTTFNICYKGKYRINKIIVGDFNAKFGQGLNLWSGFSIKGLSNFSSFYKRPSGLTPSNSYSNMSMRGIASDFNLGKFIISSAIASKDLRSWCEDGKPMKYGIMPILNIAYYGSSGQISITSFSDIDNSYNGRLGVDYQYSIKGIITYGEMSSDYHRFAGLVGLTFPLCATQRISLQGRYYPKDFNTVLSAPISVHTKAENELGGSLGWEYSGWILSLDWARKLKGENEQCKLLLTKQLVFKKGLFMKLRYAQKIKNDNPKFKEDLRLDFGFDNSKWLALLRMEASCVKEIGFLSYMELGYRGSVHNIYIRGGGFKVDDWQNRIYVYERDAPGNFNIPALYGRGYNVSMNYAIKYRNLKCYLRFGTIQYLGAWKIKKPGRTELKFQINWRF